MEVNEEYIFQINSQEVLNKFQEDNYLIEYCIDDCDQNLCVIYFSSNDLYYPNTPAAFSNSILEKNKFEWKRNQFPRAKKHIFIRDIRKQWYIGGINSKIDSPNKLADFLKRETESYKVFTIGSSAGGYAAILFGSLLNVNRVYAFNAQLNLNVTMKVSNPFTDPILFEKANDDQIVSYFDLSHFILNLTECYYFQSCQSQMDIDQYNGISSKAKNAINLIRFKTTNHGFPVLRVNLPYILSFDKNQLDEMVNKTYHPIVFSIRLIGISKTIQFVMKALLNWFNKKRLENHFSENKLKSRSLK